MDTYRITSAPDAHHPHELPLGERRVALLAFEVDSHSWTREQFLDELRKLYDLAVSRGLSSASVSEVKAHLSDGSFEQTDAIVEIHTGGD